MLRAKKKNIDFSFFTEDSMLKFQNIIFEIKESTESWVDAVVSYCDDHALEVEDVIPLMSDALISKLRDEGLANRTIKDDSARLPF